MTEIKHSFEATSRDITIGAGFEEYTSAPHSSTDTFASKGMPNGRRVRCLAGSGTIQILCGDAASGDKQNLTLSAGDVEDLDIRGIYAFSGVTAIRVLF